MHRKWCIPLVQGSFVPYGWPLLRTGNCEPRTPTKAQPAESAYFVRMHASTGNQHLKILFHAHGRHQMFQLQRHFRPFLRNAAVFEGIGKLIPFANAEQKLRLGEEGLTARTNFFTGGCESSEIDVGGEILLAGSLVRIGAGRMMTISHEGSAV